MKPEHSVGFPEIDDPLIGFPEAVDTELRYAQHVGYKSWKIPDRRENWLQWNDGGTRLPIRFDDSRGAIRTWKVFARFGKQPRAPWDKPAAYEHDHK